MTRSDMIGCSACILDSIDCVSKRKHRKIAKPLGSCGFDNLGKIKLAADSFGFGYNVGQPTPSFRSELAEPGIQAMIETVG